MSIDARIIGATAEKNGACWLSVEYTNPSQYDGEPRLWIANPPADGNAVGHLVECEINIGNGLVGLGNKFIGWMLSASVIRLMDGWMESADEWTKDRFERRVV